MTPPHEVSPPVVTPALAELRAALDAHDDAGPCATTPAGQAVATAARALLTALELRTYSPAADVDDDRGEQVVITVYGVDLSIRRRGDGVFVHIDSTEMPEELRPVIGEFNNGGENEYT